MKFLVLFSLLISGVNGVETEHPHFSGIYPHLSFFNDEGECGTGALVPFADRLWAVTYAPHMPEGSSDKLYEIDEDLKMIVREESIGGTPANRMIHRESNQLFIGPYAIDQNRKVRAIPYSKMFGRPTGNARHLTDPANKIYYATMEEGFYEVDVKTLEVKTLFYDQAQEGEPKADLPGYHGKGLYSGQGRLVYANNGQKSAEAKKNPFTISGVLSQWDGKAKKPEVILRNQFTEVTGPGGIYGSENPTTDPIWAHGWDPRSLILMCLDDGQWHRYRLPKASHSYDGAHGWNTEWPRIREIGEGDDFLMTMHGMFWKFPKTFSPENSAGIAPRSSYLKVIGDFARWGDHVVMGCDDTAKAEFLNTRKAKGKIAAPQSQSNLWFVKPDQIDHFGSILGRGSVWLNDKVEAGVPSDPFLFANFKRRALHLTSDAPAEITIEIDRDGTGQWELLKKEPLDRYNWLSFPDDQPGTWIRLTSSAPLKKATAWFTYGGVPRKQDLAPFKGLALVGDQGSSSGLVRARSDNKRTLHLGTDSGVYTLDDKAKLTADENNDTLAWIKKRVAIPSRKGVLQVDAASVLYIDDKGKRFRIPKGPAAFDQNKGRLCREVATERDLFNCHGTFYELPAENALGFARVRPVASHQLQIHDFCSYRGMLVLSGIDLATAEENPNIVKSDDGKAALWLGAIDDLWKLGKPTGTGGPWKDTPVKANTFSDPYLMTGYDKKTLSLTSDQATTITAEIDITGNGDWHVGRQWKVDPDSPISETLPEAFQAYWIRFSSGKNATVTAQLEYR